MVGILIPLKCMKKELGKPIKNLWVILIMMELNFLWGVKILARSKRKTVFAFMCIVMKTSWLFQSTFKIKNLKTRCICYKSLLINHIICRLTDLCFTKQSIKTKNSFAIVVHSALVVKMCWQSIKKFVWALMVHNL